MRKSSSMIAGGRRHKSMFAIIGRQTKDGVGRAAQFEAAGGLPIFQFEINRSPGEFTSILGTRQRRSHDETLQPLTRCFDIVKTNHFMGQSWHGAASHSVMATGNAAPSFAERCDG